MKIGQQLPDNYLTYNEDGSAQGFFGPDAIAFYQAAQLAASLRLYAKCGMIPTRGVTITVMLKLASGITKKAYRRGEAIKAADDLTLWARTMKAALPVVEG